MEQNRKSLEERADRGLFVKQDGPGKKKQSEQIFEEVLQHFEED